MTDPHDTIPGPVERARLNAALAAHGTETGWWDEHGSPAPWPENIDDYQPTHYDVPPPAPGEPPF